MSYGLWVIKLFVNNVDLLTINLLTAGKIE
jgi:hypothetical protein